MTYTTLVSTDQLAAHLDDWAIADCRFDLQQPEWGRAQYRAAHIPGAVYVSLNGDLSAHAGPRGGRHPLPTVEVLAATLGRLGIERRTQVVVYDQDMGMYASRLWWTLRYLGHEAVALLDGGCARWTAEGRPTRSGDESRTPVVFEPSPRPEMLASADEVRALIGKPGHRLIDARGPERFEGKTEPIDRAAGHIPGAANHYFRWNVRDDGTMQAPEALRAAFTSALDGHTPPATVMYCGSGVSACHNLLAMTHAGLPGARLYVGSWSDWSSDPANPIETGPARNPQPGT